MMGFAEIEEDTPDIMNIKLGNLPGKSKVIIKLSYLQKLDISQNKFWKFTLLGELTPRFPNSGIDPNKKPINPPQFVNHWDIVDGLAAQLEQQLVLGKEPAKPLFAQGGNG
jgi:hypothetical protein